MKPTVNTNCVANTYTSDDERIVEVFDKKLQQGCLISVRRGAGRFEGKLIVEVYRGDGNVVLRHNGVDAQVPA
jgi:hypothetical protein